MYVVGLAGKARSGKNTVGERLAARSGWPCVALADPLRKMLASGGFVPEGHNFEEGKEAPLSLHGRSPRYLLQTLGTEWGRNLVGKDIWVLLLGRRIDSLAEQGAAGVIITDIRFPEEAEYVRRIGGRVVHLHRPGPSLLGTSHPSESGIDQAYGDIALSNDGTLFALDHKVKRLLSLITGGVSI